MTVVQPPHDTQPPLDVRPPLVIGCGALARELVELTRHAGLPPIDLVCLPASLHNRPERIPGAVAARIRRARREGYDRIFVAYADCGTGGRLDAVLEQEGVARLEGAHCYEVYAGRAAFAALHEEEPGTFYLTDYLARSFEALVIRGLGLDRHPELLPLYFGHYRRLVYLAQTDDPGLTARAAAAADRLGLAFERRPVGLGELAPSIAAFAATTATPTATPTATAMTATAMTATAAPMAAPSVARRSLTADEPRHSSQASFGVEDPRSRADAGHSMTRGHGTARRTADSGADGVGGGGSNRNRAGIIRHRNGGHHCRPGARKPAIAEHGDAAPAAAG